MPETRLPALVGTDPLAFLAALGVLRLTADHLDPNARLAWDQRRGSAVLHSRYDTPERVAEALHEIARSIPKGAVLPDVAPGFPKRKVGTVGSDPVRVPRSQWRRALLDVRDRYGPTAMAWMEHIVTDLAIDKEGRAHQSLWIARSRQQTVHSFFDKSLAMLKNEPSLLLDAFVGWRRCEKTTGENLDHRAINDAAADARGTSIPGGFPGPTWLAIMAIPLLRVAGDGTRVAGTLWHRMGRENLAVWPLWQPPLTCTAVVTLLEHPALVPFGPPPTVLFGPLAALGVFHVCAAHRRRVPSDRQSSGVLAPASLVIQVP